MNKPAAVVDSSALLAVIFDEGIDNPEFLLGASISSVNLCEIATKFVDRAPEGEPPLALAIKARTTVEALGVEVIPFDTDQAIVAAEIREFTKEFGLSLGDRACLGLGYTYGCPVYTADRAWANHPVKGMINVILVR